MNKTLDSIMTEAIKVMIEGSVNDKKLKEFTKKHENKIHFVPIKYRIFGGMLQSLNIKFGNFIEEAVHQILLANDNIEILGKYSGKRFNKFEITKESEQLIDKYITTASNSVFSDNQIKLNYNELIKQIIINEGNKDLETIVFKHDVDILFKDKEKDIIYYTEIKYNDDHDTGKFVDINRKLLKTYAYLIREVKIYDINKFKPLLFFFTNKRMKGNIYIPEDECIYRGKKFFDAFTTIKYEDLETYMLNISENESTIKQFDDIYNKVVREREYSYDKDVTIYSIKEDGEEYKVNGDEKND